MHYFRKLPSQSWVWRLLLFVLGAVGLSLPVQAELSSQANFRSISVTTQDARKGNLAFELDLLLSEELRIALNKGMPLFFTLDVELLHPRQLWFDQLVYKGSRTMGIRYNMLLREWRISQNDREYREFSLEDALQRITKMDNWNLNFKQNLIEDVLYEGQIRLRLDTSLLARPFQITALNNSSAWSFSTSWKNFNFRFSVAKPN